MDLLSAGTIVTAALHGIWGYFIKAKKRAGLFSQNCCPWVAPMCRNFRYDLNVTAHDWIDMIESTFSSRPAQIYG